MRYSIVHDGIPVGFVDLAPGELVAGRVTPTPAFDPLRATLRAASDALLTLGFFAAATPKGQNGGGEALRAAAALHFDLLDDSGQLTPATFVNVIEAPDGGLVALVRFGHAHAPVPATFRLSARHDGDGEHIPDHPPDV